MDKQSHYLSYLLRLWQTTDGDATIWRASLDSPSTGERLSFASLEALFAFLEGETKQNKKTPEHQSANSVEQNAHLARDSRGKVCVSFAIEGATMFIDLHEESDYT